MTMRMNILDIYINNNQFKEISDDLKNHTILMMVMISQNYMII